MNDEQKKWDERAEKFDKAGKAMTQAGTGMMGMGCGCTLLVTIPIIIILLLLL